MGLRHRIDSLWLHKEDTAAADVVARADVSQTFYAVVQSGNIRYVTLPEDADPAPILSDNDAVAWAWSPYRQIVIAGVAANPCWLCGLSVHTGAVETFSADIAVATGAIGGEEDIAMWHIIAGIPTAVGVSVAGPMWLPYPVQIHGSPRFAARIRKSTAASFAGVAGKLIVAIDVGA